MRGSGARVYVAEVDPICALQACMEGYEVVRIEDVIDQIDIFITATGNKDIIKASHMAKMKNNAIVGNIGHFDNEIEYEALKQWPGVKRTNIKPQVDKFTFETGNSVIILAEGILFCNFRSFNELGMCHRSPIIRHVKLFQQPNPRSTWTLGKRYYQ